MLFFIPPSESEGTEPPWHGAELRFGLAGPISSFNTFYFLVFLVAKGQRRAPPGGTEGLLTPPAALSTPQGWAGVPSTGFFTRGWFGAELPADMESLQTPPTPRLLSLLSLLLF